MSDEVQRAIEQAEFRGKVIADMEHIGEALKCGKGTMSELGKGLGEANHRLDEQATRMDRQDRKILLLVSAAVIVAEGGTELLAAVVKILLGAN
jgi:hypothetical protein